MVSDNLIIISLLFYLFVLLKLSSNHPVQMFLYQYIKKMEGGIKNLNKEVIRKKNLGADGIKLLNVYFYYLQWIYL